MTSEAQVAQLLRAPFAQRMLSLRSNPEMTKTFRRLLRGISACFRLTRPGRPSLSKMKAPPTIIHGKRSDHAMAIEPRRCSGRGVADGNIRSSAGLAGHYGRLRPALVRAGSGPQSRSAGFAPPIINRTFRTPGFRIVRRRRVAKVAGSRTPARRRWGATGTL